jgi:hypothetical protein
MRRRPGKDLAGGGEQRAVDFYAINTDRRAAANRLELEFGITEQAFFGGDTGDLAAEDSYQSAARGEPEGVGFVERDY